VSENEWLGEEGMEEQGRAGRGVGGARRGGEEFEDEGRG
jgi:hypothetical protein